MRTFALLAGVLMIVPTIAQAQEIDPFVHEQITVYPALPPLLTDTMTVQGNFRATRPTIRGEPLRRDISFVIANEGRETEQVRHSVRRWIYEFALRECDRLRDDSAQECRLHAINARARRQPDTASSYRVTGSITLAVTPR
jgi:hypothetical protein